MRNFDGCTTVELYQELSDYYKDVNGFRPQIEGLSQNRELIIKMITNLDAHMDLMKSTEEGRARLREDGWVV